MEICDLYNFTVVISPFFITLAALFYNEAGLAVGIILILIMLILLVMVAIFLIIVYRRLVHSAITYHHIEGTSTTSKIWKHAQIVIECVVIMKSKKMILELLIENRVQWLNLLWRSSPTCLWSYLL